MLSRFSKWGRAAAYLVVLAGLLVWLTVTGFRPGVTVDPAPPSVILVAAYVAYVAGSTAERRHRKKKLMKSNREV